MIKIYQDFLLKNGLNFIINEKKITTLTKKSELNINAKIRFMRF